MRMAFFVVLLPGVCLAQELNLEALKNQIDTKDPPTIMSALQSLAEQPDSYSKFALQGYAQEQLGQTAEARKAYERAFIYRDSEPALRVQYGLLLIHLASTREIAGQEYAAELSSGLDHLLAGLSLEAEPSETLLRYALEGIWRAVPHLKAHFPLVWAGLMPIVEAGMSCADSGEDEQLKAWWHYYGEIILLEKRPAALEASWYFSQAKDVAGADPDRAIGLFRQAAGVAPSDSSRARCHIAAARLAAESGKLEPALEEVRLAAQLCAVYYNRELVAVVHQISANEEKSVPPDWRKVKRLNLEVVCLQHVDNRDLATSYAWIARAALNGAGNADEAAQAALKAVELGGHPFCKLAISVLSQIADYVPMARELETKCRNEHGNQEGGQP